MSTASVAEAASQESPQSRDSRDGQDGQDGQDGRDSVDTSAGIPSEPSTLTATPQARRAFYPLRVTAVDRLTDDSVAVAFEVPGGLSQLFEFAAGQSVTLRRSIGGEDHRRSYSLCSPAGAPPRIAVRHVEGGLFSAWLTQQVRVGDVVEVQPPSGSFAADPDTAARHLCIAAGSGITPMLSIASTVLTNPRSQVTLIYGNRRASTIMFAEELADLKNTYGARLDLIHVLSREPREVELLSGRLDADRLRRILRALVPLRGLDHVWLCGPFGMLNDARSVLTEVGVPSGIVHVEHFYVGDPPPQVHHREAAIAGSSSQVSITLDGRTTTSAMSREHSILDGAAATRSDLPFACKGGVCGTCRARVVEGDVDLRRNYALAEDEVARGFVLTCQSLPVSARVSVDFDA